MTDLINLAERMKMLENGMIIVVIVICVLMIAGAIADYDKLTRLEKRVAQVEKRVDRFIKRHEKDGIQ